MPTQNDDKQKVSSLDQARARRGAQAGNTNAVRKRGGQKGNTNAAKPGVVKKFIKPVQKAVKDAGKDYSQDWRTGMAAGDKIAGLLSKRNQVAASYKNKNPKI